MRVCYAPRASPRPASPTRPCDAVTELRIHHRTTGDDGDGGGVLVVSEVFGPTFQGEGPSSGQRAMFVRLGRCNLDCAFCDTAYTWDWTRYDPDAELRRRSVDDARLIGVSPSPTSR